MKRLAAPAASGFSTIKILVHQKHYIEALRTSIALPNPNLDFTDALYAPCFKSGFRLDPFLSASLISHVSRSLSSSAEFFARARQLLNDTDDSDIVVFNSILSGLARFCQFEPCFMFFNQLRQKGLKPDVYTLSSLIKASDTIEHNGMAHGLSIKMGLVQNVFLISGLVENYLKNGLLSSAEKCFEESSCLDYVVWTAMINGYIWNNKFDKAKELFKEMRGIGLDLNEFTLTSLLTGVLDVKEGQQIQGFSKKKGFLSGRSLYLHNAIMNMYSRCGYQSDAIKVFDEIPDPDVVSWTERIGVAYDGLEAFELFQYCILRGLEVNEYTMINTVSKIGGSEMLKLGEQIHGLCYKNGYLFVVFVCNALISMYGKSGEVKGAQCMFDEMNFRDYVSWNALVAGYSENGLASPAISIFSQMRKLGMQPTEYTLASILDAVSSSKSMELLMQIHSLLLKWGFMSEDSMLSCLMIAYGKCGGVEYLTRVFDEIGDVDLIHMNSMIGALIHCGSINDVLELFRTAWNLSYEVDSVTVSIVLKACGILTELELGRVVHSLSLKCGFDVDYFVESAIIDAYCKCGSLHDAKEAFRSKGKNNLAAWNAMMMGYAQCGSYCKVIDLFNCMYESGIKPDEISYLAVLSSCCHAGLVNEAQYHLYSMFKLQAVTPCVEHYACVVDLLGRVGLLEDAMRTIHQMPIPADARIWQILLSACNMHNDIELGKVAARNLLKLQPENESAFVLLSNMYASAGVWNAAGEVRREMKEKVVNKEPGYSWIQVG
ncbi:hypothetical protein M9H77_32626 [Catharanthus roseus]|uniref:Uncharacterized protein n=1 Tax=Catharanthus roseus TaxID=4058 RepID=A0ACC0A5H0_CATRO|nr:hypothetical protein M9H77_32626 [Catharanthus roseus]